MVEYPKVVCDLGKLHVNVERLADILHSQGKTFAAVTKCFCAEEHITEMLEKSSCDWLADSRLENIISYHTSKPRMLLRIAQQWEVPEIIEYTEYSFQSEPSTIVMLGREAARRGKKHGVMLALDMGDLREGCFFKDEEDIMRTAEAVLREDALELSGVGTNLGCFGGVKASPENMNGIAEIAAKIRRKYDVPLPYVSGMSTLAQRMLLGGTMPEGVNHGRFGEYWECGFDTVDNVTVPGMYDDAFVMEAQVVEVKVKDSKPIGDIGADAFGHVIERPDLGPMRRGIIAVGAQDIDREYLIPMDPRVRILGGSSDHTLLNLSGAPDIKTGDIVKLRMQWGAVMRAYTSRYVAKEFTDNPI